MGTDREVAVADRRFGTEDLRFAKQVYGPDFNPLLPLQAPCYFQEPSLRDLPEPIQTRLVQAGARVRAALAQTVQLAAGAQRADWHGAHPAQNRKVR